MQPYAVYVRVSTDRDEQVSSVENQVDICRNWLERNGFIWDESCVYKDEGISGTLFIDRPAIQLILEKAKQKKIDTVIFKSISRLARDLKDSLEIREVFLAHGVRIISVEEGYDSNKAGKNDMAFELWSLFSAQYSRTLSSSISAALAAKVRRGEHIGKVPYGYDRVEQKLVIKNEEAEVVRQIYKWYNDGWGFKKISNELNELGIKPKNNNVWQLTSVQRLIRNTIYKGTFILNQYTNVKVGGKKKQIRNPPEKWLIFENHHPAIVDKEIWDKANGEQVQSRKVRITPWNEFRYLAKCSECGSNMTIVQSHRKKKSGERTEWKYLKCSQYRRAGRHGCVNHVPIQYGDFREFILNLLMKKGESILLNLTSNVANEQVKKERKLQQSLKQNEQRKKNLLDVYMDGLIDKAEFEMKRHEVEQVVSKITDQLLLIQKTETVQMNIQTIKDAFRELKKQNQDLFDVFQTLIEEIIVHPEGTIDITYTFEEPK
ncbi:recombinase family protein [Bacillus cereus]|uniref:recombinase family protein n=1 Tax=Bacillus cereus TaxID=1396 RepID=UPI000846F910|nr:recombinase family protein [Bacillus cereus]AOM07576.1 Site-specific recombinase [Bacillus cereus]MCC2366316.1 recombinase family protein [Bacillus cereus]MCC2447951.1 recombinase family protein [Bacillus cereus]MCC2490904.1 recombinase family protein [Bacillus cereus]MCU5624081.1 recombinase family protein [Bacillus cereus]